METKKPVCSYGAACFRKNPFHFKQLSHPHLEKLLAELPAVNDQTVLPDKLDFKCGDRKLVLSQLQVLREIERNKSSAGGSRDGSSEKRNDAPQQKSDLKRNVSAEGSSEAESGVKRSKTESPFTSGSSSKEEPSEEGSRREEAIRARIRAAVIQEMKECGVELAYVPPMGEFALKWTLAAPYHLFFTVVQKSRPTWTQSLSVTFSEILDRSLGVVTRSVHTTMVLDVGWLLAQYMLAGQDRKAKISLFYQEKADDIADSALPANIDARLVKCPTSFGSHHCKISILLYSDGGIRIIVTTANLYRDDWDFRTQGVWVSPHLPRMEDSAGITEGESPTAFKSDFIRFLERYGEPMADWKEIISRADCSSVNVAFVASAPGEYPPGDNNWGYRKLGKILLEHTAVPEDETDTTIVAQASSIGSLGSNYDCWLGKEIIAAMSKTRETTKKVPSFKFIFPTIDNYRISYDMGELANCLCNPQQKRQEWIREYMHKWRSNKLVRTKAIPHIKTFTRLSVDDKRIWWFVLGSANLSKAAWGQMYRGQFRILSYEAGIVFIPKFVTGEKDFSVCDDPSRSAPKFPLPYDLPLVPYANTDRPFTQDFFRDNNTR